MEHSRHRVVRPGSFVAAVVVSLGLIAAACGGDNSSSTNTTAGGTNTTAAGTATTAGGTATTAGSTPKPGGKITVRVEAEVGNPWVPANTNCDTGCQTRWRTWFEPLMAVDANTLTLKPYLAESVTPSADYKTWTFKVRPGITFSDGTPLNADVVIDNIQRYRKSALIGPALAGITDVQKVDDMTLNVMSGAPWVDLADYFTGPIASSKWLAETDTDPTKSTQPVGTGPFVLSSYTPGESTIVKKNPNYWRKAEGLPYLDEIDFRVISDELTAANALKSGELDVLVTENGQNIKDLKDDKAYHYQAQDKLGETNYELINLSQDGAPLSDRNVRCGLTAATDSKTLSDVITAGQFPVANGPFSPGQQGHLDDNGNQKYDPAKAKQLLQTWTDAHGGQKPHIILSTTTDATVQQQAQLLQQWWNEAGADVEIQAVEQSKLITNALVGDPNFNVFSWRNHSGAKFEYQNIWWNSATAQPPGQIALNFGRLKDPQIDAALNTARTNPDAAAQVKAAEDANRQFASQCYIIPTTWALWGIVSNPRVQGLSTATFPDGKTPRRDGEGFPGSMQWSNVYVNS